ncbi:hypothetical protein [Floridanema evergladense]|uniref:hypothetical protein n=1 Tax=Floridanema evergladense TaxID=3396172 RepID=UPI0039A7036B
MDKLLLFWLESNIQRLGFWDTPENRELVTQHLQQVVQTPDNVVEQVKSSWEIMPDGTRRFVSAEIYGR